MVRDQADELAELRRRQVAANPGDAYAWHNLAAALNDRNDRREALWAAQKALELGLDAAETWVLMARAHRGLGQLDDAEAAYGNALCRRPDLFVARQELAQLIWRRSGDVTRALEVLPYSEQDGAPRILAQRVSLLEAAGRLAEADREVSAALQRNGKNAALLLMASQLAAGISPERALVLAEAARELEPALPAGLSALCQAQLACGLASAAVASATRLVAMVPDDQFHIALLITAWRLANDPRGDVLSAASSVQTEFLERPLEWLSMEAFLADLKSELGRYHDLPNHPFGMSVRAGSQTSQDLRKAREPAICAFQRAIGDVARRHMESVGAKADPFGRVPPRRLSIAGMWSVRLGPQGFHTDHVHPAGYLSSAFYVDLPRAIGDSPLREGWLKFGQPGIATEPQLPPTHFVIPQPGLLVLFPSYLWHGTVPLGSGDGGRLTVAFDLASG